MNSRGNGFAIHSEGGHWEHSCYCHGYTVGGIAVVVNIGGRSIQNDSRHMTRKMESCERNQDSGATENILEDHCYDETDANRRHYILRGNYSETSYRRRCLTAKYDAARLYFFLVFPLDGYGEIEVLGLDWPIGNWRHLSIGRQWQCGLSEQDRPLVTANLYDSSKASDVVCQNGMENDFVIRFEMTCDGGVRSRVGSVSSQPQISSGNGAEIFASNVGRRSARGICGKNGGDAVKNLDGRWNGVFVSSIQWPWSFELGCAEAGCESSCSVSFEMDSRIGCGYGFDSCVASTTTESRTPHGHGHDHDHDHDHDCGYDCPEPSWSWPRRSAP